MAVSAEKISVHSIADLKNTSDDAIPNYLNSLGFTQSHTLSDTRLALGYSAFAICAATFCWDYQFGFESTKYYTAVAVLLYSILNGALTFWIWAVEKGTVYVGTNKNGDKIQVATKTQKHVPIYNVTITTYSKANPTVPNPISLKKPFTQWFDKQGHFVSLPFQQMFASNVSVIGKADPTKVVEKKKVANVEGANKSMDEKWASLLAESSGVSLDDLSGGTAAGTGSVKSKGRPKKN
ncbi:signal peptidase-like protein complex component [Mollisia scopiformis]|uniref:Signal peptidase complex subunit 2 n=1 Tax=Mollisia scopiformis TaxID=149040 RepID=A0A194WSZ9_MOLSC|nr:signal peptidase-like protein complex component [Mollisia scopiformis]KUJ11085.1 signal peptidase-like protein complex component [Mollisia scopiformis]